MYESPKQQEAIFDAKGIETVRRDSCPVVAKMLERSIRILFSTHNITLVRSSTTIAQLFFAAHQGALSTI